MYSLLKVAGRAEPAQGISRKIADARNYRSVSSGKAWPSDSHWRNGLGDEAWLEVGRDHLSIFERFANGLDLPSSPGRVIECGLRRRCERRRVRAHRFDVPRRRRRT